MPTLTVNSEPVDGPWVEDAIRGYFAEVGGRILGRPVTDEELRGADHWYARTLEADPG